VLAPATLAALPSTRAIPDRDVLYACHDVASAKAGHSSHSLHSGDVTANEQTSVSRVANRGELPLLLDKARQFPGEYIESLEERALDATGIADELAL
jgi:hypothetical protein